MNNFQKSIFLIAITASLGFVFLNNMKNEDLLVEHLRWGSPNDDDILVRNAYETSYNEKYRIPNFSAYHVTSEYLQTPTRKSRFSRFRQDPDVDNPVNTKEYNGLFDSDKNYARGHLAPYKVLGGDRDDDDTFASLEGESDPDDELTVYQGNYMSNIAPQIHHGFNGSNGLWYNAERWIQDDIAKQGTDVWVYSGCFVKDTVNVEFVGPDKDIAVPDYFYKVVIKGGVRGEALESICMVFPHVKDSLIGKKLSDFIKPVDYLENLSGLDFFKNLDDSLEENIEAKVCTLQQFKD